MRRRKPVSYTHLFLTGMAKVNGYAIGASAALDEAHTRHYAELLVEKAGKSLDSNVQRAATELQDQLDFGSAPTEKDIGCLLYTSGRTGGAVHKRDRRAGVSDAELHEREQRDGM